MFVRLLIALALIAGLASPASADQQPTFLLTVKQPAGAKPSLHAKLVDTLKAREDYLKPKLLDKTKAHPASRMTLRAKLQVAPKGVLRANAIDVDYRDGKGPITDESIKTVITDALAKTRPLPKDLIGATVDITISILQP